MMGWQATTRSHSCRAGISRIAHGCCYDESLSTVQSDSRHAGHGPDSGHLPDSGENDVPHELLPLVPGEWQRVTLPADELGCADLTRVWLPFGITVVGGERSFDVGNIRWEPPVDSGFGGMSNDGE